MNLTPSTRHSSDEAESAFERTHHLLGDAAMQRIATAHVTIAGLGGVGAQAVEALARCGVGALRLCDFDRIETSNINRQLFALHSTLGRLKAEVAHERVLDIHPDCRVETCIQRLTPDNVGSFLDGRTDVLVDAIDDFPAKVALLKTARQRDLPVVSAMGAARRHDPSRLRVANLRDTRGCPLARRVRHALRNDPIHDGIRCIFSDEPPAADSESTDRRQTGGKNVLGSLVCVTATAGLFLAHEVLKILVHQKQSGQSPPFP